MSKHEKLLKSIRNNPSNVKFENLQKLLLHYGFTERQPRSGSSHFTYTKNETIITIPKKKPVNKIYVKQVLKLIDEMENDAQKGGSL